MIDVFGSHITEWNGVGGASMLRLESSMLRLLIYSRTHINFVNFNGLLSIDIYPIYKPILSLITDPQSQFKTPQSESDQHLF